MSKTPGDYLRDLLAHNYDVIGLRYVWDAVEDVSRLRDSVEALLSGLDDKGETV